MSGLTQIAIETRGLSYNYPDRTAALADINIAVKKGGFTGILGSNGSGKTTMLRCVDGLIRNFGGTVLIEGRDVKKLSPREIYSRMGLVFQNPDDQLFAGTLWEDVAFGPTNMGFASNEIDRRVKAALADVELDGLAGKSIQHLSFGQKKRACIAGLLAMGHGILLLDEPTAGLDPMGEYRMMRLLAKLNRENGTTILMATHSVDLVPLFLDELIILSRGQVHRHGSPEDVFTAPEEMAGVKLRLPQIAELIHELKHKDNIPFDRLPLTVGEARREIIRKMGILT
ncbi:MAG: ATP-binding cassette domain-containing protein [Nitrospirae bacterium]|nr:ATP-binding cassette domain-containing protein [Nitrospirota bacterium]